MKNKGRANLKNKGHKRREGETEKETLEQLSRKIPLETKTCVRKRTRNGRSKASPEKGLK